MSHEVTSVMVRVCRVWRGQWGLRVNPAQRERMADQDSWGPRGLKVSVRCHMITESGVTCDIITESRVTCQVIGVCCLQCQVTCPPPYSRDPRARRERKVTRGRSEIKRLAVTSGDPGVTGQPGQGGRPGKPGTDGKDGKAGLRGKRGKRGKGLKGDTVSH